MKLRQKAFIIIFAVTLALTTAAGALLLRLWKDEKRENDSRLAAEKLSSLTDALNEFISDRRNESDSLILGSLEFQNAITDFFTASDLDAWLVFPDGKHIGNVFCELDDAPKENEIAMTFIKDGDTIISSRIMRFENGSNIINLRTRTDGYNITKATGILFAAAFTISVISALAGTFVAVGFEKKLADMNRDAVKMVGDRAARFTKYRQPDLDGLAASLNAGADAVSDDMEKLQTIADGRRQFTDNLAHEMKTPLTSILGFADILRIRRSLDDRTRMEYANIIFEEARRMRGLSGKLLELATAGNTELDFESVEVTAFFDEIRLSVLPLLAPRGITLKVFPAPISIKVDRELFKSLIYNLIENAAKASPDGAEIRLICETTPETVKISVSDNGCGMTSDQIRRATEPFYMADKSRSRKAGGAGLGLALCAEIAEKHRARMVIQSKQGKGTTVTLIMLSILAAADGGKTNEIKTRP